MIRSREQEDRLASARGKDIRDVALSLGVTLARGNKSAYCPEHSRGPRGGTASMSFFKRDGVELFKCHSCQAAGDAVGLVRFVRGWDFRQALDYLAGPLPPRPDGLVFPGVDEVPVVPLDARSRALTAWVGALTLSGAGEDFLAGRGITAATAARFGVVDIDERTGNQAMGAALKATDAATCEALGLAKRGARGDYYSPRAYGYSIVFPYHDETGRVVHAQTRRVPRSTDSADKGLKWWSCPGEIPVPWNIRAAMPEPYGGPSQVWIVEGVLDALRLEEAGVKAIGVPGTQYLGDDEVERLLAVSGQNVFVVAMDADTAGVKARARVADLLVKAGHDPLEVAWPETWGQDKEHKDICDWFGSGESLPPRIAGTSATGDAAERAPSLADAPVPAVRVPKGWTVGKDGVWKSSKVGPPQQASVVPVLVQGRLRDVVTGREAVAVVWLDVGPGGRPRWESSVQPREVWASAKEIVKVSSHGFPVSSGTAALMSQYLTEATALVERDGEVVTSQFGWCGDGFVLGAGEGVGKAPRLHVPSGMESVIRGYAPAGTYDGWLAAARSAGQPRMRAALYASLAAPLLDLIPEAPNVIVDFCGPSSTGKTTAQMLAASVWGNPQDKGDGVVFSWQATRVGVETLAALHQHVPLILDDSTKAKDAATFVPEVVYDFSQGKSKMRGAPNGGVRPPTSYRTVLVSSGEQPISAMSQKAGAAARVLTLWGAPAFGWTKERVDAFRCDLIDNHGTAARVWVEALSQIRADPQTRRRLVEEYRASTRALSAVAKTDIGARLASSFAVLCIAGQLADALLGVPYNEAHMEVLWEDVLNEGQEQGDRPLAALRTAYLFAAANQWRFYGVHVGESPIGGWAGAWQTGDRGYIAFIRGELEKLLRSDGHDPGPILRQWRERGWLRTWEPHRLEIRLKVWGGTKIAVLCIEAAALVKTGVGAVDARAKSDEPVLEGNE